MAKKAVHIKLCQKPFKLLKVLLFIVKKANFVKLNSNIVNNLSKNYGVFATERKDSILTLSATAPNQQNANWVLEYPVGHAYLQ
ncbi:hypothetical protein P0F25_003172 [Vibrio metschnikovii]|nr:hypothetical protein [Vibrio metschnikovii]